MKRVNGCDSTGSRSGCRRSEGAGLGGQSQRERPGPECGQAEPWARRPDPGIQEAPALRRTPSAPADGTRRWAALGPRFLLRSEDQAVGTPLTVSMFSFLTVLLCKPLDGFSLYRIRSRNPPCSLFQEEVYFSRTVRVSIVIVVVAQSCWTVTPWTAAHQASLSFTVSQSLLKLMCIESVMPPNHLILCRPLLPPPSIFPSIRVFSSESALHIRWPNYWSLSFSISPYNEYSELVSFRMD